MTEPRMAMSADFLTAFAKLPSQQQRQVRTMIGRFERDSRSSGLSYEEIAGAMEPNMRSIRIDRSYRAIVLKPDEGDIHVLLWADKHDDAYQWATRHSCTVNPETGALQVYQPRQVAELAADPSPADEPGVFGQLKKRELLRLGVPAEMLSEVLDIRDEAGLEEMAPRLPVEAYEALFLFMAGESYEQIILERETPSEPVDPTDFAAALDRDDTRSRFVVIENDRELEEMFSAPLERWRVFLHPSQRLLRGKGYRFRLSFDRHPDAWREAIAKKPLGLGFPDRFYSDEWEQVIQANGVELREEYLRVARTGRGVRLNRAARSELWRVFEEYRAQLAERGVMEAADCYRAAAALLERERIDADADAGSTPASRSGTFASVIVDEAQDMVAPAWRLIRRIVPDGPNDLFIVGDAHQRIYSRHRVVLSRYGIEIRGRARKLRLNYRTTEETRRWADGLLERRSMDDLDGGTDDNRAVRSVAHGPEPHVIHFRSRDEQAMWLVRYLEGLMSRDETLRGVCIVTRTRYERDAVGEELMEAGLPLELLEAESPDDAAGGVRLATMHRVKGLEFDRMVIASVNENLVPLAVTIPDGDGPEHAEAETAERALLYVAATRAKKDVTVLSFGTPSPFLD